MRRRDFLRNAVVASGALWLGCGRAPVPGPGVGGGGGSPGPQEEPGEPVAPPEGVAESAAFSLGLASGDVAADAAVLWTHHAGDAPLELAVWQMEGDVYVREVARTMVARADGGFVHVDVSGLSPGARYRYAFFEMEAGVRKARSPIGRFRAALPADALEPIWLGAVACTSNGRAFETLSRAGARTDLDVFLLIGDTTYNDGARTREAYRTRWQQNLATPGYRALRAATSLVATWDDHEFDNDWDPETIDPDQSKDAKGAFFEHLPLRRINGAPDRLWRQHTWGKTLEIFALDCRAERKPSTRNRPDAEYLSRAQMDWLKAGLSSSQAVFKVIVNSVPIGSFPGAFQFANRDRWEGYPAQRTEILEHIDDNAIGGVLWVSGDFHLGSIGRVAKAGVGARQLEVLAGPGGQVANPLYTSLNAPQFDWATGTNNYAAMRFDPATRQVRVMFHDANDDIIADRTYAL